MRNMKEFPVYPSESVADWVMPWPSFEVDAERTGLMVIDYQNYSVNPQCGLTSMIKKRYPAIAEYYVPRIKQTVQNTRRILDAFRRSNRRVIFTRHGALLPDSSDMIARRRKRDMDAVVMTESPSLWCKGSFEHEIITELAPRDNELVIDKNTSSPFNGTGVDHLLRNMNLNTLVMTGMAPDMCVETTARAAADRGYNVIVVDDAVATFVAEHHRAALSALARVFGQVWDTEKVLSL